MAKPRGERTAPGTARVAFIAHLDTIKAELEQGYTAQAIYERHKARLATAISYPQFTRYVRQLRDDGVTPPVGRRSGPMTPVTPAPPAKEAGSAPTLPVKGSADARHQPAHPRTFVYDGNPSPDDDALIRPAVRKPEG